MRYNTPLHFHQGVPIPLRNDKTVRRYETGSGIPVYCLPVEAFPNHVTNCYLIKTDPLILLDAGSAYPQNREDLDAAFLTLREEYGESLSLADVEVHIISHGHIDHFGGLNYVLEQSGARLGIHELDAPVIAKFRERLIHGTKSLHHYLDRTGLSAEHIETILAMHYQSREIFKATPPDFTFTEGPLPGLPLTAYHVPGHCPGQVCLQLDDILFSTDHVLAHVTPLQAPESIMRNTGLGHYLQSLRAVRDLPGIRLALPAHEDPIDDFSGRVEAIIAFHGERLEKTLALCDAPINIKDIARGLFGERRNHHVFLALLEAGAHVEYLYERGLLSVSNLDEVRDEYNPVLLYTKA